VPSLAGLIVLVHALAGILFFAGLVGRWITLAQAARADDVRDIHAILRVSARFERMVITGSLIVLLLGVGAAIAQGRPLLGPLQGAGVDWLFVSLVLFVSVVPLVPLVFLPRGRVFEAALQEATVAGRVTPELRAAFRDPVVAGAHVFELGAVTIVLVLMLTKPF
jgi:Predicted integral membrane protein (DUF2269)